MSQYTPLPIVVYVSRFQDEDSAGRFSRFVESYKLHPAGCEHELMIIKKGFQENEHVWHEWIKQLDGISIKTYEYPDAHHYSGYIRAIIEEYPDRYILPLVSTTEILVDNWLDLYMRHAKPKRILGHGGSFVSLADPPLLSRYKLIDLYFRLLLPFGVHCKTFRNRDNFFPFPNPTLRTTAFMIPPNLLESIYFWPKAEQIRSKIDEYLFESGKYNFSIQAIIAGYSLLIVGADGKVYPMSQWKESNTFCYGDQKNLIIADQRCKDYDRSSFFRKKIKEINVYGLYSNQNQYITQFEERIRTINVSQILAWYLRSEEEIIN